MDSEVAIQGGTIAWITLDLIFCIFISFCVFVRWQPGAIVYLYMSVAVFFIFVFFSDHIGPEVVYLYLWISFYHCVFVYCCIGVNVRLHPGADHLGPEVTPRWQHALDANADPVRGEDCAAFKSLFTFTSLDDEGRVGGGAWKPMRSFFGSDPRLQICLVLRVYFQLLLR